MREVIPSMELVKDVSFIFIIHLRKTEVSCKVFEGNQGFIAVADTKKISPRTKHITIKYHHFQIFVQKKIIRI